MENYEIDITAKKEAATIPQNPKRRKKQPPDAQDRVVSVQLVLAGVLLLGLLATRFLFPSLLLTMQRQYQDFITEAPVWDLDDVRKIVMPAIETIKDLLHG
jgi:hypothetical protein